MATFFTKKTEINFLDLYIQMKKSQAWHALLTDR
jgi:hypothetical protein